MMSKTQSFPDTTGKAHRWTIATTCARLRKCKQSKTTAWRTDLRREEEGFFFNGVTLGQSTISRPGPTSNKSWATQIGLNRFKAKEGKAVKVEE